VSWAMTRRCVCEMHGRGPPSPCPFCDGRAHFKEGEGLLHAIVKCGLLSVAAQRCHIKHCAWFVSRAKSLFIPLCASSPYSVFFEVYVGEPHTHTHAHLLLPHSPPTAERSQTSFNHLGECLPFSQGLQAVERIGQHGNLSCKAQQCPFQFQKTHAPLGRQRERSLAGSQPLLRRHARSGR
jgi:hypothetical protein